MGGKISLTLATDTIIHAKLCKQHFHFSQVSIDYSSSNWVLDQTAFSVIIPVYQTKHDVKKYLVETEKTVLYSVEH